MDAIDGVLEDLWSSSDRQIISTGWWLGSWGGGWVPCFAMSGGVWMGGRIGGG